MNEVLQWIAVAVIIVATVIILVFKLIKQGNRNVDCHDCPTCPLTDSCKKKEIKH